MHASFLSQEFKFMRHRKKKQSEDLNKSTESVGSSDLSYFERYADAGSPFDIQAEEEETEDVMATNGVCIFSESWADGPL